MLIDLIGRAVFGLVTAWAAACDLLDTISEANRRRGEEMLRQLTAAPSPIDPTPEPPQALPSRITAHIRPGPAPLARPVVFEAIAVVGPRTQPGALPRRVVMGRGGFEYLTTHADSGRILHLPSELNGRSACQS